LEELCCPNALAKFIVRLQADGSNQRMGRLIV